MKKITKQVPITIESTTEKDFYVTSDGREFENEEEAIVHEQLDLIKEINISDFFPSYNKDIRIVYFENEQQIEMYERKCSGNMDHNTYMSWVSCKGKFRDLPKWIVCHFEHHDYENDYTAFYYTLDEFKGNLTRVIDIIDGLNINKR